MRLTRRCVLARVAAVAVTGALLLQGPPALALDSLRLALGFPDHWPVSEKLLQAVEEYQKATEGAYLIDVFPQDALGPSFELVHHLLEGYVDLAIVPAGYLALVAPELEALGLPLVFHDREHFQRFVDSDARRLVAERLAAVDLRLVAASWLGDRQILTRKEVRSAADLQGLRLRGGRASAIEEAGFAALGIAPVQLGFAEVYSALDVGVIDAVEGLPSTMVDNKLIDHAATLIAGGWGGYTAWLVARSDLSDRLAEHDLELLERIMQEAMRKAGDEAVSREADAVAVSEANGVEIVTLDQQDEVRDTALEAMQQAATGDARDLIEAVLSTE